MNTKFNKDCPVYELDGSLVVDHNTMPTTTVKFEEEVGNSTFGYNVSQIDVVRKDGSISRFWITVKENNRGQVLCEVSANDLNKSQSRRKSIIGSWFKRHIKA